MMILPPAEDGNFLEGLERVLDACKQEGGDLIMVVAPYPGKYYVVNTEMLFSAARKGEPKDKQLLIHILDVHDLDRFPMPQPIVEAHMAIRAAHDARREGKN